MSTESEPTFTCFPLLPSEIRLKVWKHALPGPRVIDLTKYQKAPAMHSVCVESRQVFLAHYRRRDTPRISAYIDYEVDIVTEYWKIPEWIEIGPGTGFWARFELARPSSPIAFPVDSRVKRLVLSKSRQAGILGFFGRLHLFLNFWLHIFPNTEEIICNCQKQRSHMELLRRMINGEVNLQDAADMAKIAEDFRKLLGNDAVEKMTRVDSDGARYLLSGEDLVEMCVSVWKSSRVRKIPKVTINMVDDQ